MPINFTFNFNIPSIILGGITIINIISVLSLLFLDKRNPVDASNWLLILTFLPIIGVIIYIFFGRRFKIKTEDYLYANFLEDDVFNEQIIKLEDSREHFYEYDDNVYEYNDPLMADYFPIIKMNYELGNNIYTQNNTLKIYTHAKPQYEDMFEDIANAKETINIIYFIIKNDDTGKKFIDALTEKAKEGVEVRLLYDYLGSILTNPRLFRELKKAGGKVYRFFPLTPGNVLRANYRNHRKIVVVDGKYAYTGGINIGDEYLGLKKETSPWRDTHVRITGHAAQGLQARFLIDWHYATKDKSMTEYSYMEKFFPPITEDLKGDIGMQVISSGPDTGTDQIKINFIKMFSMAKKSILIQTPYFIPDENFLETLKIAASSGVKVRIMIPGIPDKHMIYQVTLSYVENLLDCGVEVYFYPGFIHSKMVVIDDEIATIGTCNMDMRSLHIHFEVNVMFYDTKTARECSRIFDEDAEISELVDIDDFKGRGLFNKILERVLRLFAPLL